MQCVAFDSHKHHTWAWCTTKRGSAVRTQSGDESAGSDQQPRRFCHVPVGHAGHSTLIARHGSFPRHSSPFTHHCLLLLDEPRFQRCPGTLGGPIPTFTDRIG